MKYALLTLLLLLAAPVAAIDYNDIITLFGNDPPQFIVGEQAAVGDVRAAVKINEPFAGPNSPFGAAVLDTDAVPGSRAQIIIGGPCINTAAAAVLGNPEECATGFEPGKAMIRMFTINGNKVLLVAGYSESDTLYAGEYVKRNSIPADANITIENPYDTYNG